MTRPEDVLEFWFGVLDGDGLPSPETSQRWFRGGPALDEEIRERFGEDLAAACAGQREDWGSTPRGRLALVVLLDQFTRNCHRGSADSFAGDARALGHAVAAVEAGEDADLLPVERYFLYMPFEHAEDREMQALSCALFERLLEAAPPGRARIFQGGVEWAVRHREAIDRFGRFPGRNAALGRESTPEEAAFLREHPSGF